MKIFLLRHASAVEQADWSGREEDRPLTEDGKADFTRVAVRLAATDLSVGRIVTSPYERALRTALILAEALGMVDSCTVDPRLAPGFDRAAFDALLKDLGGEAHLLLVGHEPDFSRLVSELTGGSIVELKKGGLARIDWSPGRKSGRLEWLVPPQLLR